MNLKKKKEKKIQESLDYSKFFSSKANSKLGEHKQKVISDINDELSYKKIPKKKINLTIE